MTAVAISQKPVHFDLFNKSSLKRYLATAAKQRTWLQFAGQDRDDILSLPYPWMLVLNAGNWPGGCLSNKKKENRKAAEARAVCALDLQPCTHTLE